MTHWMCSNCGYYLYGSTPPDPCPGCKQKCVFRDVTCYRPECGGEANVDPLLVGAALGVLARPPRTASPHKAQRLSIGALFAGLSEEQKQRMRSLMHAETYEANAVIITEGAEAHKLYLVEEGQVAVEPEVSAGMRIPVTVVTPGVVLGWSAVVPPYRSTATGRALTQTRVLAIERDALLALMRDDPYLGIKIMQNVAGAIASRLRSLEMELAGMIGARP